MKSLRTLTMSVSLLLVAMAAAACGGGDTATAPTPKPPTPNPPGPAAVASVSITPNTGSIDAGATLALTAVTRDAQGNTLTGRPITYSSNAPQIATVADNGVVTGVAAGEARITASSEGKSAEAVISVRAVIASIQIVGTLDSLEAYDVRPLAAIVKDLNGQVINGAAIAWSSSNAAVLTVGAADGIVTGIDRGTVTVTAQAGGKSHSVTRVVVIKYRSLALGTQHACDLASGGIAWCWGLNGTDARLGDAAVGDGVYKSEPVRVPGGRRFSQLVTFARFTCGLELDNKAYCWGNNSWGALGGGTNAGFSATPVAVSGNIQFARLSAGADHACGVTAANLTYCWGHNDWGQFGIGNTTSPAAPVTAPNGLALKDIEAGPAFSCGITMNNAAYCWGANGLGQTGEGTQMSYGNTFRNTPAPVAGNLQFTQLSLGYTFACGLTTAGQAYCWGSNGSKLGDGTTADASSPRPVDGGYTFRQLSTGFGHSCAVSVQDDVYCWGTNGNGQLGAAGATAKSPVRSGGNLKAAEVAVAGIGTGSGSFTCAVSQDRLTAYCWGRNEFGQLGNGSVSTTAAVNATPTIVVGQKPL